MDDRHIQTAERHRPESSATGRASLAASPASGVKRQLRLLSILFVVFSAAIIWLKRPDLLPWIGDCQPGGYAPGHFMAYCNAPHYGDYEYYALWNGAEPHVVENLHAADVLFLGNSRSLFGFSTTPVNDFFNARDSRHYVMGFGLGGKSEVARLMIERWQLTPRALVINADPFFSRERNGAFRRVLADDWNVHWEHRMKRWQQALQQRVCRSRGGYWRWAEAVLCSGDEVTLYRNARTGHWITDYFVNDNRFPVSQDESPHDDRLEHSLVVAEEFIEQTGVPRECIILTAIPQKDTPQDFARALAESLGVPFVAPSVPALETFDQSHLTARSAQRWSSALMNTIGERLDACTAQTLLPSNLELDSRPLATVNRPGVPAAGKGGTADLVAEQGSEESP